jgi:hypothetical protein
MPLNNPASRPQELESRKVGRHTYTVQSEILDSDGEACRARYLHRLAGYAYRPP